MEDADDHRTPPAATPPTATNAAINNIHNVTQSQEEQGESVDPAENNGSFCPSQHQHPQQSVSFRHLPRQHSNMLGQFGTEVSPLKKRRIESPQFVTPSALSHRVATPSSSALPSVSDSVARSDNGNIGGLSSLIEAANQVGEEQVGAEQGVSTISRRSSFSDTSRGDNLTTRNTTNRTVQVTASAYLTELRRLELPSDSNVTPVHQGELPASFIDKTINSCSNVVKSYRRLCGPTSAAPAATPESAASAATPELPIVHSFGMRTLFIEDVIGLKPLTPLNLFFQKKGIPATTYKRLVRGHVKSGQSALPTVQITTREKLYQLHGYVKSNPNIVWVQSKHSLDTLRDHFRLGNNANTGFDMVLPGYNSVGQRLPGHEVQLGLRWQELLFYPGSLFLQANIPLSRNFRDPLRSQSTSKTDTQRKLLFHRMLDEAGRDKFLCAEIVRQYVAVENTATVDGLRCQLADAHAATAAALTAATMPSVPTINDPEAKAFTTWLNNEIKAFAKECFGKFYSLYEPLLSRANIAVLVTRFKTDCPVLFDHYMRLLGFKNRLQQTRYENHRKRYERKVLHKFLTDCRYSNNHRLQHYVRILAAAQFCRGESNTAKRIANFFGMAASRTALKRFLKASLEDYDENVTAELDKMSFLMFVFDNLQKGQPIKFQVQGSSNKFTVDTARFALLPWLFTFPSWFNIRDFAHAPTITYVDQAIPAPFQFPAFDQICDVANYKSVAKVLSREALTSIPVDTTVSPFDPTGMRVRAYSQLASVCFWIGELCRFLSTNGPMDARGNYLFQPEEFASSANRAALKVQLHPLHHKDGAVRYVNKFVRQVVLRWRGNPDPARILMLPISVQDERTKRGSSVLIIDFMVKGRLIAYDEATKRYELCNGWDTRWVVIVGDGLTLDRIRQFFDDIQSISQTDAPNFLEAYRQSLVLRQALKRVIPSAGDLHGRFHAIDVGYRLFYGGLLQPCHALIRWKRLNGSDPIQTYEQCHLLVKLVYEELSRLMWNTFLIELFGRATHLSSWLEEEDNFDSVMEHPPQEAAVYLAFRYIAWMRFQLASGTDQVRVTVCNYLVVMGKYLRMYLAERDGCCLIIEETYNDFMPLFHAVGKSNYYELCQSLIEWQYLLPPEILHQVRINRTRRQRGGFVKNGQWMEETRETALDQHMERLMPLFKQFRHDNMKESWVWVSKIIGYCVRCKLFTEDEFVNYHATNDDSDTEDDESDAEEAKPCGAQMPPASRISTKTTKPSFFKSRVAVTELMTLAKVHKYQEGRRMTTRYLWDFLEKVTTDVRGDNEEDTADTARPPDNTDAADADNEAPLDEIPIPIHDGTDEQAIETVNTLLSNSPLQNQQSTDVNGTENDNATDAGSLYEDDEESLESIEGLFDIGAQHATAVKEDIEDDDVDDDEENGMMMEETQPPAEEETIPSNKTEDKAVATVAQKFKYQMKIVPLNRLVLRDVMENAKRTIEKAKIMEARAAKVKREVVEEHFLITKLYHRLQTMEGDLTGTIEDFNKSSKPRMKCRLITI